MLDAILLSLSLIFLLSSKVFGVVITSFPPKVTGK